MYYKTNQQIVCIDPSGIEVLEMNGIYTYVCELYGDLVIRDPEDGNCLLCVPHERFRELDYDFAEDIIQELTDAKWWETPPDVPTWLGPLNLEIILS
tara:strand:- start:1616 stop:1906 length:291 start_codon:yes stop_codon:yes gene_type:complete